MAHRKRTLKILIVDDDNNVRGCLGYVLNKKSFAVKEAVNGKEALKKVNRNKPNIIILDVGMPEMDGFETCRRLRKNPGTKDIPIIFFSVQRDIPGVIQDIPGGAVEYVEKPNIKELLERIEKIAFSKSH
jgi:DNA-binding response OmpR family regulator